MYYSFSNKKPKPARQKAPHQPLDKKSKIVVFISLLVLLVSALSAFGLTALIQHFNPADEPTPEPEEPIAKITDTLDYSFLGLEPSNQNLVYSPLSIKNGLSLLSLGAAGDTKTQITDVLGESLMLNTQNITNKLSLANAIFLRDTSKDSVLASYIVKATEKSSAEIIYDDFTSADHLDAWVSNKTFKLIDTLGITPNTETRMVLVNALALQLGWLHPFNASDTTSRPFSAENKSIDAITMSLATNADNVSYFQDNNLSIVALPLQPAGDVNLDFVAIMPRNDSLNQYLANLTLDELNTKLSNLTSASSMASGITVYIPQFKFDYELNFKSDLEELGITTAFTSEADFSNMTSEPLYVSDAIHKANITFSEDGIKAAATTAISLANGAVMTDDDNQPFVIDFNRPFLFLIRDHSSGTIWFVGTVYQPTLWSDNAES